MKKHFQIVIGICVLLLFVTAHLLYAMLFIMDNPYVNWFGIEIHIVFWIDLCFYLGILLQFILIISIIPR